MCGICGELNLKDPRRVDPERVRSMADLLSHRGPDGEGTWHEAGAALGHRRLSIIDLSEAASQPMMSSDGRFVLAYNGEVYNYREIREELEAGGVAFGSRSDTEVVLRAWERWGEKALHRFNGMWAFALWDRREQRLFLSRDRLGVKPLYWAKTKGGVVFASEIPPLLLHPEVGRTPDPAALREQVSCRYVLAPNTLLPDVKKLRPGYLLTYASGRLSERPFWTLPLDGPEGDMEEGEALGRFADGFEEAVGRRLVSDVPLGVLLSGGIDSTAIVAAMRYRGQDRIATYTAAFEAGGKYDERRWAGEVARRFHTDHQEVLISREAFAGALPRVLGGLDEPVADLAALPLYFVCEMARNTVTVLLSGQGADEVLGGYHLDRVLRQIRAIETFRSIPGSGGIARWMASRDPRRAYLDRWEALKDAASGEFPRLMRYTLMPPLPEDRLRRLLKDPDAPPHDPALDALYREVPPHRDPLDAILSVLCRGWLPDNLLTHSDRMSMVHGIEMRVPFLDPTLVRLLFRLPPSLKVRGGRSKALLKAYAARRGLPGRIVHRRKRGFPVPWSEWLRDRLGEDVRSILAEASWLGAYFSMEETERLLKEHRAGADHGLLLWNLTNLAFWGERIVGRESG